jgi:hypothetical protein
MKTIHRALAGSVHNRGLGLVQGVADRRIAFSVSEKRNTPYTPADLTNRSWKVRPIGHNNRRRGSVRPYVVLVSDACDL